MAVIPSPLVSGQASDEGFEFDDLGANSFALPANTVIATADPFGLSFVDPNTGTNSWTVTVDGDVSSSTAHGLSMTNWKATVNNVVTVGTQGSLAGLENGLYTSTATNVINKGQIVGEENGIEFFGWAGGGVLADGSESNLNAIVPATAATKKILVDNQLGAVIGGNEAGIENWSYAYLTVTNAGIIAGGADSALTEDWDGAAIDSRGGLKLTNALTGRIEGDVDTGWFGSNISNAGKIYGTIVSWVEEEDVQVVVGSPDPEDDVITIDIDHDGSFADAATKGAITSALAAKNVYSNTGLIEGTETHGVDEFEWPYQVAFNLGVFNDEITNSGKVNGDVMTGRGNDKLINSGTVRGAVDMAAGNDTVTNTGNLFGNTTSDRDGVSLGSGNNVLSNALGAIIDGDVTALDNNDSITNGGIIFGDVMVGNGTNTVTNTKMVAGDIISGTGNDTISNSDDVRGDILAGNGLNKVTNSGDVDGDIVTGTGDDSITSSGRVLGDIVGGDGSNTLTNSGQVRGSIFSGNTTNVAGKLDKIVNSGMVFGNISAGNGNRDISNSGTVRGNIDAGTGNDKLTNSKDVNGHVWLGDGVNVISNTGTIGRMLDESGNAVQTGAGADALTNGGTIWGDVALGHGDNTLTNSKVIRGNVFTGNAANALVGTVVKQEVISNSGQIYGMIATGNGNRTISNSGTIYGQDVEIEAARAVEFQHVGIQTGSGNDAVSNSKVIYGDVLLADGADTFKNTGGTVYGGVALGLGSVVEAGAGNRLENSGIIYGDVEGGSKVDTLINTKTIMGDVTLFDGADVVNSKTGVIDGVVDLGAGSDTYDGGAGIDRVIDGLGADAITLGAGDDELTVTGDASIDSFDGGLGAEDMIDFGNLEGGITIDVNTLVLGKGSVTIDAVTQVDKISGFEIYFGTSLDDEFRGNLTTAVNETIYGNGGQDLIIGGRGVDKMYGGGDEGDLLADVDTFAFVTAADSGTTVATRDIIGDFEAGVDKLWFQFDSDTTDPAIGFQQFEASDFIGVNKSFTGVAGQIRAIQSGQYLVVQVDTNADKAADFSVALGGDMTNLLTLNSDDFLFTLA